jgi:hypothetical protein
MENSTSKFFILLLALGAILVLLFAEYGRTSTAGYSQVRVRNGTGAPLKDVKVNDIAYGDIPPAGVSGYRGMASAYGYAKVDLVTGGKRIFLKPDDYVGEKPLGPGHFTYLIVTKREGDTAPYIDIQASKDGD